MGMRLSEVYLSIRKPKKQKIHLIEKSRPLGKTFVHRRGTRNIRARRRGNRLEVIISDYMP